MPDYIYLLESRLSADQQNALRHLREAAREAGTVLFLTGDAVRDLTSGHAVRDLEVSVHGNALKLKKTIEDRGAKIWGEDEASRSLYLCFPGTVRVDVISTHRAEYATPGKPAFHPATIQEDLRRRDFTANAMAISLNEGSFGLLMDPLNGAADIEARTLRLVSNYGFLEQPALLIRATRYMARLGWELDPKTRTRYENAKSEGVMEHLSAEARSQELERIGYEEEGLKVLRALEEEGWMEALFPAWTSAKADEERLQGLHDLAVELLLQGVHPDMSAAQMQLLTAKMAAKDLSALKKLMLRPGFVEEWNSLDALAAGFAKALLAKENATPSVSFKLFTSYDPEAILWLGFTTKDPAVRARFDLFLKVWPEARQRIPHALMQEMRITPELAGYREIVQALFLELIDGRLGTQEELIAFLEPHSPPAPPPQVTIKRPRAKRGEAKVKEQSFDDDEDSEDGLDEDEDLDDLGGEEEEEIGLGMRLPKVNLDVEIAEDVDSVHAGGLEEDELEAAEPPSAPTKPAAKKPAAPKPVKVASAVSPAKGQAAPESVAVAPPIAARAESPKAVSPASKSKQASAPASAAKSVAATHPPPPSAKAKATPPVKPAASPVVKKAASAAIAAKGGKAPAHALVKAPAKAAVKAPAKAPAVKAAPAKSAPAKGKPSPASAAKDGKPAKPAPKKPAPKPAKKH